MLIYFLAGDKKPAQWRAHLHVAVLAPADPHGAVFQMFDPYACGVADVLDDLVPSFRAFIVASGDLNQLNSLHSRRGDYALQTTADKLVGVPWFGCGVGCLVHASLLAIYVCIYSIVAEIY
jgi:hypothetical protein